MESEMTWKKQIGKMVCGLLGICCSMINIMGCVPLVPAYFTAVYLAQGKSLFLYAGMLAGMFWFLDLSLFVKYFLILAVTGAGVRFYTWANRKCSGWAAAVIAGVVTFAIEISGNLLHPMDRNEILLGIFEGLLVLGLVVVLHYLLEIASGFSFHFGEEKKKSSRMDSEQERMENFQSAFDGLATVFQSISQPRQQDVSERMDVLEREITARLCEGCDACAVCAIRSPAFSVRIQKLLQAVSERKEKEAILQEAYVEDCLQYPDMVEEAIRAFERMELNRAWYHRLLENRMVIAQQLDAMAGMIGGWTRGAKNLDGRSRLLLAKIAYEAKQKGILVEESHVFEDERKHRYIRMMVHSKWGGGIPVKNLLRAVSKAAQYPVRAEKNAKNLIGQELTEITLYEDTEFYTLPGIALRKKDGSSVSGDNFSTFMMDDGRYFIGISDGMGSGSRASQESELVVDLIEKFLEAGFSKEAAVRMMNSAMVLQSEEGSYSTLDLAEIDLYTGSLELMKIGASATFIKHGTEVECITAGSLPAGSDVKQEPEQIKKELSDGDFLVMLTDGVLEYLHVKAPEQKLSEIIGDISTQNAGTLAKEILSRVLLFTGGYAMDDMTILVTGIWEKT